MDAVVNMQRCRVCCYHFHQLLWVHGWLSRFAFVYALQIKLTFFRGDYRMSVWHVIITSFLNIFEYSYFLFVLVLAPIILFLISIVLSTDLADKGFYQLAALYKARWYGNRYGQFDNNIFQLITHTVLCNM